MPVSLLAVDAPPAPRPQPLGLVGLTPAQERAVTTSSLTVCVLAAAGAGKTRVLTHRVAHRVANEAVRANHVLAITFTRKAAGELRERLGALPGAAAVTATTFHGLAMSQLRRYWADLRVPEPALLTRKGRLLGELVNGRPGLVGAPLADVAATLEWAKARLVTPEGLVEAMSVCRREAPAPPEALAALYRRYEDEKRRRRLVDFDDLLARYSEAMRLDTAFAAAQRWRWQHVFVDELQDVNPLQSRLLVDLLADNADLFVVGDPNQAIYGWNGSDPAFLTEFPQRWPGAEVVRLDDNHRSSPEVVAAATAVLGRQARPVRSSQPHGPLPQLRSYPSEEAEAAGVASAVLAHHGQGLTWAAMAVLARTNSQLQVLGNALARAGVPFRALVSAEDDRAGAISEAAGTSSERSRGADSPNPDDGAEVVTVCTFHRSKGLQWRAVWLCGLEAGLVPIAYAGSNAALAEERRLLYVAMTRAERALYCSWARSRRTGTGANLWREPSPWVAVLAQFCSGGEATGGIDLRGPSGPPQRGGAESISHIATARKRLAVANRRRGGGALEEEGATTSPDQVVQEETAGRLQEWRRRLARASGVPPFVLLHDSTLLAIAERRPVTQEDLLAVPGMGPVKVSRFGPAILEVVRREGRAPELVSAPG